MKILAILAAVFLIQNPTWAQNSQCGPKEDLLQSIRQAPFPTRMKVLNEAERVEFTKLTNEAPPPTNYPTFPDVIMISLTNQNNQVVNAIATTPANVVAPPGTVCLQVVQKGSGMESVFYRFMPKPAVGA